MRERGQRGARERFLLAQHAAQRRQLLLAARLLCRLHALATSDLLASTSTRHMGELRI